MKNKIILSLFCSAMVTTSYGKGLYYIPNDTEDAVPISWSVGVSAMWDDNVTPVSPFNEESSMSLNPFVGVSFVSVTPQTTWNVYARLGAVYYFDKPTTMQDDVYSQSRASVSLTHRFNERLRFVSNNSLAYELEPDYAYGFATDRRSGEYFFWRTDNALGYRWSERFATYTGFVLDGLKYRDSSDADRVSWTVYNQFRYQLTPRTVGTATYRYQKSEGGGVASDQAYQFLLVGVEHRFSPNTILVVNAGGQLRDDLGQFGSDGSNPYIDMTLRTQVNEQFSISGFLRYGVEFYDTVQQQGPVIIEYDDKMTLRVGIQGSYQVSPDLTLFSGIDYIYGSYQDGFNVVNGGRGLQDAEEKLFNISIGASMKLTEYLFGSVSYNFTNSNSDFNNSSYDRNRVSLGLNAEF
ncbi:MAG: hypothetical protein AB8D78_09390 [Akkermansiaceae bacterium]